MSDEWTLVEYRPGRYAKVAPTGEFLAKATDEEVHAWFATQEEEAAPPPERELEPLPRQPAGRPEPGPFSTPRVVWLTRDPQMEPRTASVARQAAAPPLPGFLAGRPPPTDMGELSPKPGAGEEEAPPLPESVAPKPEAAAPQAEALRAAVAADAAAVEPEVAEAQPAVAATGESPSEATAEEGAPPLPESAAPEAEPVTPEAEALPAAAEGDAAPVEREVRLAERVLPEAQQPPPAELKAEQVPAAAPEPEVAEAQPAVATAAESPPEATAEEEAPPVPESAAPEAEPVAPEAEALPAAAEGHAAPVEHEVRLAERVLPEAQQAPAELKADQVLPAAREPHVGEAQPAVAAPGESPPEEAAVEEAPSLPESAAPEAEPAAPQAEALPAQEEADEAPVQPEVRLAERVLAKGKQRRVELKADRVLPAAREPEVGEAQPAVSAPAELPPEEAASEAGATEIRGLTAPGPKPAGVEGQGLTPAPKAHRAGPAASRTLKSREPGPGDSEAGQAPAASEPDEQVPPLAEMDEAGDVEDLEPESLEPDADAPEELLASGGADEPGPVLVARPDTEDSDRWLWVDPQREPGYSPETFDLEAFLQRAVQLFRSKPWTGGQDPGRVMAHPDQVANTLHEVAEALGLAVLSDPKVTRGTYRLALPERG